MDKGLARDSMLLTLKMEEGTAFQGIQVDFKRQNSEEINSACVHFLPNLNKLPQIQWL